MYYKKKFVPMVFYELSALIVIDLTGQLQKTFSFLNNI